MSTLITHTMRNGTAVRVEERQDGNGNIKENGAFAIVAFVDGSNRRRTVRYSSLTAITVERCQYCGENVYGPALTDPLKRHYEYCDSYQDYNNKG